MQPKVALYVLHTRICVSAAWARDSVTGVRDSVTGVRDSVTGVCGRGGFWLDHRRTSPESETFKIKLRVARNVQTHIFETPGTFAIG